MEILSPGKPPVSLTVGELFVEEGSPIADTRHANMKFKMKTEVMAVAGSVIRKAK